MSLRLERAIEDVNRLERKILMYQAQKKQALDRLKQVENEEIIRTIRGLSLDRTELVKLLKGLQDGTVRLTDVQQLADDSASAGTSDNTPADEKSEEAYLPTDQRDSSVTTVAETLETTIESED